MSSGRTPAQVRLFDFFKFLMTLLLIILLVLLVFLRFFTQPKGQPATATVVALISATEPPPTPAHQLPSATVAHNTVPATVAPSAPAATFTNTSPPPTATITAAAPVTATLAPTALPPSAMPSAAVLNCIGPKGRAMGEAYVVGICDTLTHIARLYGISLSTLVAANPQVHNPDLIFPGEVIIIPGR